MRSSALPLSVIPRSTLVMPTALLTLLLLSALSLASSSAFAVTFAVDDFSTGAPNGGTGWADAWDQTLPIDSSDPLSDSVSSEYLRDVGDAPPNGSTGIRRTLSVVLTPDVVPEVWSAVYLRPTQIDGWQFGFEFHQYRDLSVANPSPTQGAQAGQMYDDPNHFVMLARSNAESRAGDGASKFFQDQPALLAMRIYRATPADTLYNRADLYADLDGNDGRDNVLVPIRTGLDLGSRSAASLSVMVLLSGLTSVDFDYVAVGDSLSSVLNPIPEPSTALLLGIGLSALAVRREKR